MHVISGLKTLFGVVVYRLASTTFYAVNPRWHTWPKVVATSLFFVLTFSVSHILESSTNKIVILTVTSTFSQLARWLLCFIIAQFALFAIEDMSLHWGFDTFGTSLLVSLVFIVVIPLFLPLAIRHGLFWCDCNQQTCLVCQFCKNEWDTEYGIEKKSCCVESPVHSVVSMPKDVH